MRYIKSFLLLILVAVSTSIYADIRLPRLISDGMILQRDKEVNVWGWADPNENVSVQLEGKKYVTKTNKNGEWKIVLPPHSAGGPYNMVLAGKNSIEIKNILFGDVWLCSGQSNMELPMRRVRPLYENEIKTANNSAIRFFTVPQKYNFKISESDYTSGKWEEVNPQTIQSFSAIAYFFAAELYNRYKVPVGILNASLGGSPIQAWLSETALKKFPDELAEAYKWRNDDLIRDTEKKDSEVSNRWYTELNEKDAGHTTPLWSSAVLDDSSWKTMNIPGFWSDLFPDIKNGVVWFRKTFDITAEDSGKPAFLNLGRIVDADSVFINGKYVGSTTYQYPPRWYNIPENLLVEGKNVITVRVISNAGQGGFILDKPYEIKTAHHFVDLKGEWKLKQGCEMAALPSQTFVRWKPLGLYNAMIAPQNMYAKKGIVWYQGESNTDKPQYYQTLLTALIHDWRNSFHDKKMPFIYAQLPNFMETKSEPAESNWAELRESQRKVLKLKNTGMAVTIDLGEWNDIHPLNKKPVSERLARLAAYLAYGDKNIVASAPMVQKVNAEGNTLVLRFPKDCMIKTTDGKAPLEFAIAGEDGKYFWAQAKIENNKIVLHADEVAQPVKVRYAWADNPKNAKLIDSYGNHMSPFECAVTK